MTSGGIRLVPFALVSTALHAVVFMGAPERFEIAMSPSGDTGAVSVRLLAAGPKTLEPTEPASVAGSDRQVASISEQQPTPATDKPAQATKPASPERPEATSVRQSEPDSRSETKPEPVRESDAKREHEFERAPEAEVNDTPRVQAASEKKRTRNRETTAEQEATRQASSRSQDRHAPRTTTERGEANDDANEPAKAAGAEGKHRRSQLASRARQNVTLRFRENFRYPRLARQQGWEGHVVLAFRVHADGRISNVRVVESSGRRILDESARKTLMGIGRIPELADRLDDGPLELKVPVTYRLQPA